MLIKWQYKDSRAVVWTGHICRQKVQRFKKRGNDLVNVMFLEKGYFFVCIVKAYLK